MNHNFIESAKKVIQIEQSGITALLEKIGVDFENACELIFNTKGKVILTGMGKSGHIASKIAATLASTGTPSFFIHPAEAGHGDLGMIEKNDLIIAISYSGESDELITLLPALNRANIQLIAMTGNKQSTLATQANIHLDISVSVEACPHNLAPTSSTTVTLVLGDAIAISLLEAKKFSADDFALSHPCGSLGRRLLTFIKDIMHTGDTLPLVQKETTLKQAIIEMSQKKLGFVIIIDEQQKILGIFTDGDLRRVFEKYDSIGDLIISQVMSETNFLLHPDNLATKAVSLMEEKEINSLPIVDDNNIVVGAINMHTLLHAKII
jgi:arabinose-5-phosphate isomerase